MTEHVNFKFDVLIEFAKAHHKVIPRGKVGLRLGLGCLPNIWALPCTISVVVEGSDFKMGIPLEFIKSYS